MRNTVIANWKMHGNTAFVQDWATGTGAIPPPENVTVAACPPLPYIPVLREALPPAYKLGAQNVAANSDDGPHTGEVSARMLADVGCTLVLAGHSERRAMHHESDAIVAAKMRAATAAGMQPVLCVGEDDSTRATGGAVERVCAQLNAALHSAGDDIYRNLIIAYEPIWAIGSGKTPSPDDIEQMHSALRAWLISKSAAFGGKITLLYGGSVSATNAKTFISIEHVNGFLVGGASLKPNTFAAICEAASQP